MNKFHGFYDQDATFARPKCAKHYIDQRYAGSTETINQRAGHTNRCSARKPTYCQSLTGVREDHWTRIRQRNAKLKFSKSVRFAAKSIFFV